MLPLPLVDNDTLMIDNSTLSDFMECPRQYEYKHLHLREKSEEKSAINMGSCVHLCMKLRYTQCGTGPVTPRIQAYQMRLIEKFFELHPTPLGDHRTIGYTQAMVLNYNKVFQHEPFDLLRHPVTKNPIVEEPISMPLGVVQGIKVLWQGRIDLPIFQNGFVYVMDHKTSSVAGDYMMHDYRNSNAQKGYCWSIRERFKLKVAGSVMNVLVGRKPAKTSRAKLPTYENPRFTVPYDDDQLDDWRVNALHVIDELITNHKKGFMPMHPSQCVRKFGCCEYLECCELSPMNRLPLLLSSAYVPHEWSPLHPDEIDLDQLLTEPIDEAMYNNLKPTLEVRLPNADDYSELLT